MGDMNLILSTVNGNVLEFAAIDNGLQTGESETRAAPAAL
jgi:hypothetical protein